MDPKSPPSVIGAKHPQSPRIMSPPTRHCPSPKVMRKETSSALRRVVDESASPSLGAISLHPQPAPDMKSPPPLSRNPPTSSTRDVFSPPPPAKRAKSMPSSPDVHHHTDPTRPPPPQRNTSDLPTPRNHLPWAQVVMQPETPTNVAAASLQFSRSFLRPEPETFPRASLEDLISTEPLPEDDYIETDDEPSEEGLNLESCSVSSSIYRGHIEHGRRYARDSEYIAPSDEKQFESMAAGHLMYTILESQRENPFFRSPIPTDRHQHVLDIGTGDGNWAIDTADRFETFTVHGVDLYPPPQNWIPPNCIFEVDDMSKPWTWQGFKFGFIHIRLLLGAFSSVGWDRLYKEAYNHLEPGGWIEHVECDIDIKCEDGSLPPHAQLVTFGRVAHDCAERLGYPLTIFHDMKSRIERAGFINIQDKVFKAPIGCWPRHPTYKDAGKCSLVHFKTGLSGWLLRLLTKHGNPEPWESDKAQIFIAVLKSEIDAGYHIYQNSRRVWAQKPYIPQLPFGSVESQASPS